jgi:uncharacterized protein YndB with AHSA1/START domain
VWAAVTEPEHLAHWFPTTIEGDRQTGARLRFSFRGGEADPFDGEMLAYEPMTVMEIAWGPDIVRLELREVGNGTELTLLDTLEEQGKAARDGAGWHTCLDRLQTALSTPGNGTEQGSRGWRELHAAYVADFGPEAATIGPPDGFE